MNHGYFKDRISAYFDRELKNEEEYLIAEHLKDCSECQKLYQELEALEKLVEQKSGLNDDAYWEKSAQKIDNLIGNGEPKKTEIIEIKKSQWSGLRWKIGSIVATAAVLIFIAVNYQDIEKEVQNEIMAPSIADMPKEEISQDSISKKEPIEKPAKKPTIPKENKNIPTDLSKKTKTEQPAATSAPAIGIPKPVEDSKKPAERTASKQKSLEAESMADMGPMTSIESMTDMGPITDIESMANMAEEADESAPQEKVKMLSVDRIMETPNKNDISSSIKVKGKTPQITINKTTSINIVKETTLADWQNIRDSLTEYFQKSDKFRAKSATKTDDDRSNILEEIIVTDNDLKLIESHYNIALLTKDENEYNKSYDYLKKYSENKANKHYVIALEYLKKLDKQ